ncbi:hypothetical protein D3C76_1157330 [compost metagenome]
MPNTNDRAISRPPATTMGSMNDTPVSRCLYTPVFSPFAVVAAAAASALFSTLASARALSRVAGACLSAMPVPQR